MQGFQDDMFSEIYVYQSVTSRLETSRYRDFFHFFRVSELVSTTLVSKKSQYRSQKILVSKKVSVLVSKIFGLKKSLGIGLENLGLKKSLGNWGLKEVSVLVSKDLVSKKSLQWPQKKSWYFTYFKIESESPIYFS